MKSTQNIPFLRLLKHVHGLQPAARFLYQRTPAGLDKHLMGMNFLHPIGVASGIDRQGEYVDSISCFSPSFLEIGPLRDVRTGIKNLQAKRSDTIVLCNLSNIQDPVRAFTLIYDFVDAIVLNVSCNSTVSQFIDQLLEQRRYNDTYKPIVFKLFPDLTQEQQDEVAHFMLSSGIDGVMVGAEFVGHVQEKTHGLMPVIATAEISNPERAAQILDSGADLIAVTNSPVHYGPNHLKRIVKYLEKR